MSNIDGRKKIERPIYLTVIAVLIIVIIAIILCCCNKDRYTSISVKNENYATAGKLSIGIKHNSIESTDFLLQSFVQPGDIITIGEDELPGKTSIEIINKGNTDILFLSNFTVNGDVELADVFYFYDLKLSFYKEGEQDSAVEQWLIQGGKILSEEIQELDASGDQKISLSELLSSDNQQNGIEEGWEVVGLPKEGIYLLSFTLKFDKTAGREYQAKSIDIGYQIYATQMRKNTLEWLTKENDIIKTFRRD